MRIELRTPNLVSARGRDGSPCRFARWTAGDPSPRLTTSPLGRNWGAKPQNRVCREEVEVPLSPADQVKCVERVTGIEPAWPAWKPSHETGRLATGPNISPWVVAIVGEVSIGVLRDSHANFADDQRRRRCRRCVSRVGYGVIADRWMVGPTRRAGCGWPLTTWRRCVRGGS